MIVLMLAMAMIDPGQCGICHPDVRTAYEPSVHAQEFVVCTGCHGGNPESLEIDDAHGTNFKGKISRKEIPDLCARCHSDLQLMRPYNLPTDQFALYQTSQHGKMLAKGDTRVAVCTDCHGTHSVLPPEDPESKVFPQNIPATCGRCHGDPAMLGFYGKDTNAHEEYMGSVHARELLEEGNLNAPECSRCHGAHGATPPGVGDVDKVCGSCHTAARSAFLEGPHAVAMIQAGLPECVSCHGNHSVQPAVRENIAQFCLGCHQEDSPQVSLAEKIDVLFQHAEEEVDRALELITEAEQTPLYVEDYRARLEEARTHLLEAEPALHAVSLDSVERYTRAARSLGEEIQADIQGELGELKLRRVGLIIFWFYLLLTLWILFQLRQRVLKRAG